MMSARQLRQPTAAVAFLHALPKRFHDVRLYNMTLQVCASGRDYGRALEVLELVDKLRCKKDIKLLTSMINGERREAKMSVSLSRIAPMMGVSLSRSLPF